MNVSELESSYRYCFLDMVYTDSNDKPLFYEVALSDTKFKTLALLRTGLENLQVLYGSSLITDFEFQDNYLVCNPNVRRAISNTIVYDTVDKLQVDSTDYYTIYSLLTEGYENGFVILDKRVVECRGNWDGTSVSPFSSIGFSESTMTVYVNMYNEDGMYRNILISMNDGVLQLHPFYFGVPSSYTFSQTGCEFVKQMMINGELYSIYSVDIFLIYDSNVLTSYSLINKAVNLSYRYKQSLLALKDFSEIYWELLEMPEDDSSKISWVGGSKSYESYYGISFKSTCRKLSADSRREIVNNAVKKSIELKCNLDAIKAFVESCHMTSLNKHIFMRIALIFVTDAKYQDSKLLQIFSSIKHSDETMLFYYGLFLYRVRSYLYLSNRSIVNPTYPIISGGNEIDSTVVTEGFNYGAGR